MATFGQKTRERRQTKLIAQHRKTKM